MENQFSPTEVARSNAAVSGWSQFTDCLGVCRFVLEALIRRLKVLRLSQDGKWISMKPLRWEGER